LRRLLKMKSKNNNKGLLGGIRILDLSDEKADFCTKLFADLGATVIKVENPGGDSSRKKGPFPAGAADSENSLSFYYHNTNKFSITLNLECREGRLLFLKLVKRMDVVVDSFEKGYLEALGIGFEALRKINRALVLASVTGFGQKGPRTGYKSCDLVASAFGGQMYVTGDPSSQPLKLHGEQPYLTASLFAAIGILLALRRKGRTGKGDFVDISLQEAVVSSLEHVTQRFFSGKTISGRRGRLHWDSLFYVFPCKDGFIQMTLFENWETLIEWMDGEGMAEDLVQNKYKNISYRRDHVDHIVAVMGKWTATHNVLDLFKLGQLMRFPWAPVQSPKQILNCPQLKDRRFFVNIENPEEGSTRKCPGPPYKFSTKFSIPHQGAPRTGEDNIQFYCKELGFSMDELKRFLDEGII